MKALLLAWISFSIPFAIYSKDILQRDLADVKKLVLKSQSELRATSAEINDLQSQVVKLQSEILGYEIGFGAQFKKVIFPLLHWPAISFQKRDLAWVQRDHEKFVLGEIRKRLVERPMILIADRENELKRLQDRKTMLEEKANKLSIRGQILELQLEDLKSIISSQKKREK